jgi:hypothetical protein
MLIRHSKYKNTGIIFELLVRQITSDTLSGKNSESINILKKYFNKTELGREYKLYENLLKHNNLTEGKADIVINTILEKSKNLNYSILKRQKYNLIKEIKTHYNLEEFFKTKLPNYKVHASIYTLIESINENKNTSIDQVISNKISLMEYLTSSNQIKETKDNLMNEFSQYDKDIRILTYKILLEKFNTKYSDFSENKKLILKEFINSVDNNDKLKQYYNDKIVDYKTKLTLANKNTKDQVVKIKINEISNLLVELNKKDKVTNDHMVNLLQYSDLIEELQKINGK